MAVFFKNDFCFRTWRSDWYLFIKKQLSLAKQYRNWNAQRPSAFTEYRQRLCLCNSVTPKLTLHQTCLVLTTIKNRYYCATSNNVGNNTASCVFNPLISTMEKPIICLPQKRYIVIIGFRRAFIGADLARLSSFPKHFTAGNVQVSREKRSLKGLLAWSLLTGFF